MKKLWNWLVGKRKKAALRKWKSAALRTVKEDFANGNNQNRATSDDLLSSRKPFDDFNDLIDSNGLNKDIEDFEDFFKESANAIQSALERQPSSSSRSSKRSTSQNPQHQELKEDELLPKNSKSKNEDKEELTDDLWKSSSRIHKSSVRVKKKTNLPQVSVSFADEPASSTVIFDENEVDERCSESQPMSGLGKNELGKRHSLSLRCTGLEDRRLSGDIPRPVQRARGNSLYVRNRRSPSPDSLSETDRKRLQQRRQSNIQVAQSASGRRTSTTLIPLTSAQIHLVRSLWRQVYTTKGPTLIGSTIFHRLFFKSIKTRDQFKNCVFPPHYLNHDIFSKAHAKVTGELIDQIVENLDNLEVMNDILIRIGSIHTQIPGEELPRKMWNLVAEVFIDCTLEWGDKRCRTETVRKAWALITAYIVERIKQGCTEERISMIRRSSISYT